jgi:hypothetical protein
MTSMSNHKSNRDQTSSHFLNIELIIEFLIKTFLV